ncbi:hypothetical protein CRD36_02805 [Paremcibacter congregatus]|uniref:Thioredoxin domain-containing protein n=2 Tax=Paremcibacter congregatus TaxID=2043170 RepID=A0A2G4YTH9_9PROT|nr:hypothetical protein CRD36_02805 [Paremcibacter congregatus]QDE26594.1 DsbA family protein [Paremcibacter congregatus]|tara:strand:+ start:3962 stop:4723 length:762 start_codon:yes stop_codon:yes gene_type:complete
MAKMISKKIALLIAALVIGGGALMVSMMAQPEDQVMANAEPETKAAASIAPAADTTDVGFLNYDMVLGDPDAPIEIIEYAAISCPHCAHFHADVLPDLKKKYIDTGKAKLIYRNFIFDNPFDVYASIMTRCVAKDKFFPTVKTYFEYQKVWMKGKEMMNIYETEGRDAAIAFSRQEVAKVGKMAGITEDQANACFANEEVVTYLLNVRQTAVQQYNVNSTPTLIVGGKAVEGHDFESLAVAIDKAGEDAKAGQ